MERIAEPLRRMGAQIETTDGPSAADDHGRRRSAAIDYELPVASAQVKSAILLAGLGATGRTTVIEPSPTRDHTELMLRAAGVQRRRRGRRRSASIRPTSIRARHGRRPGRLLVGRAVHRRRDARARVADHDPRRQPQPAPHRPARRARPDGRARRDRRTAAASGVEQVGDLEVRYAEQLTATKITSPEVPLLVDELPLFGLLAACARGESWVYGAGELRHKETDRIEALVDALRAIGVRAQGQRGRLLGRRRPGPSARRPSRRRSATTGSRCSGPSQASSPAKASRSRAPRAWGYPSPASSSYSSDWPRR